jgi:hypothetical protein
LVKDSSDDYDVVWRDGYTTVTNALKENGSFPNKFDAVQPEENCIWYPPTGGVFRITGY